jgi:hypothetical protein
MSRAETIKWIFQMLDRLTDAQIERLEAILRGWLYEEATTDPPGTAIRA